MAIVKRILSKGQDLHFIGDMLGLEVEDVEHLVREARAEERKSH